MTSCGCFEAICAYVPECNGIMVVNREFLDDTPVGMTFSSLAGSVGGGQQTPGFMGCGKVFLTSRKFLFAEGGHRRLVWMPKELKALLAEDLKKRCQEQGVPDLFDKIADESVATDPKAIRAFMEKVGHPALQMADMSIASQPGAKAPSAEAKPAPAIPGNGKPASAPVATAEPAPAVRPAPAATPAVSADLIAQIKEQALEEFKRNLEAASPEDILRGVMEALTRPQAARTAPVAPPPKVAAAEPVPAAPTVARSRSRARPDFGSRISGFGSPRAHGGRTDCSDNGVRSAQGALRNADLHGQAGRPALRRRHPRAHLPHRRRHRDAVPSLGRRDAQPPAGGHGSLRPGQREIPAASCATSTATCCTIRPRWPRSASRSTAPT